jgi:hypothetical protein
LIANTANDGTRTISRLLNEMFCFEPKGVIDALADGMQEHGLHLNKSFFDNDIHDLETLLGINDIHDDNNKRNLFDVTIEYNYSVCIQNEIKLDRKNGGENETMIVALEKEETNEYEKTQELSQEKSTMNYKTGMHESSEGDEMSLKASDIEIEELGSDESICFSSDFSEFYTRYFDTVEQNDNDKSDKNDRNDKNDVYMKDILGCYHSSVLFICATEDIVVTEADIISTYETIAQNSTLNTYSNDEETNHRKSENHNYKNENQINTHCNSSKFISIGKKAGNRLSYGHYDLIFGEDAIIDVFPEIFDFIMNFENNQVR